MVDQLFVVRVVLSSMRTRPDDRHAAAQHVEDLRQFVQAAAAQERTETRDTCVVLGRLLNRRAMVVVHTHRAELEHVELTATQPMTALAEEHRTRRAQLDAHCNGGHQRPQAKQRDDGQDLVLQRLGHHEVIVAVHTTLTQIDHRHIADLFARLIQQTEIEQVRYQLDVDRVTVQALQQLLDVVAFAQRQRDPDLFDLVFLQIVDQRVRLAQARQRLTLFGHGNVVWGTEITDQVHADPRVTAQVVVDFHHRVAQPHHHHTLHVHALGTQMVQKATQHRACRHQRGQATDEPQADPIARHLLAHLHDQRMHGKQREHAAERTAQHHQFAQQATAAPAAVQREQRKADHRIQQRGGDRQPIRRRRHPGTKHDAVSDQTGHHHHGQVEHAQNQIGRSRIFGQQSRRGSCVGRATQVCQKHGDVLQTRYDACGGTLRIARELSIISAKRSPR